MVERNVAMLVGNEIVITNRDYEMACSLIGMVHSLPPGSDITKFVRDNFYHPYRPEIGLWFFYLLSNEEKEIITQGMSDDEKTALYQRLDDELAVAKAQMEQVEMRAETVQGDINQLADTLQQEFQNASLSSEQTFNPLRWLSDLRRRRRVKKYMKMYPGPKT